MSKMGRGATTTASAFATASLTPSTVASAAEKVTEKKAVTAPRCSVCAQLSPLCFTLNVGQDHGMWRAGCRQHMLEVPSYLRTQIKCAFSLTDDSQELSLEDTKDPDVPMFKCKRRRNQGPAHIIPE